MTLKQLNLGTKGLTVNRSDRVTPPALAPLGRDLKGAGEEDLGMGIFEHNRRQERGNQEVFKKETVCYLFLIFLSLKISL